MPFATFNPINPRTNPVNFHKKILRIGDFEKWPFLSRPFWIFFQKKIFFCFIPIKISHKLCIRMDGTQFLWLWWFTAKNHSPQTYQPAVYILSNLYTVVKGQWNMHYLRTNWLENKLIISIRIFAYVPIPFLCVVGKMANTNQPKKFRQLWNCITDQVILP